MMIIISINSRSLFRRPVVILLYDGMGIRNRALSWTKNKYVEYF